MKRTLFDYRKRFSELVDIASVDDVLFNITYLIQKSTDSEERNNLLQMANDLITIKKDIVDINRYYTEPDKYGWQENYFTGIKKRIINTNDN